MNYPLVLTLISLVASAASGQPLELEERLAEVCQNKNAELKQISEARSLIEHAKSHADSTSCSPEAREAILALGEVIMAGMENVCTPEKVAQIKEFHLNYIVNPQNGSNLPRAVRSFFVALGLQVSVICKRNMINSLLVDTHEKLGANDIKVMELWAKGEDSLLNKVIGNPNDFDDVLLASEINRMISADNDQDGEQLYIQVATGKTIQKIKLVCERRLRPFYQRLILPLVDLSNLGYNYQGEDLERELFELRNNDEIKNWFKIVFLCESVSGVQILTGTDEANKAEEVDQRVVRILTREEVDAIKKQNSELEAEEAEEAKMVAAIGDQIVYEPKEEQPIVDTVVDTSNKDLMKQVKTFEDRRDANDRIRDRMMRKIGSFLKESFLKGGLKVVSSLLKGDDPRKPEEGAREAIVKALDNFVHEKTSAESGDVPVAGLKDYGKRLVYNAHYMGPRGMADKLVNKTVGKTAVAKWFWRMVAVLVFIIGLVMMSTMG